jgi:putative ABC transport system permease protein
MARRFWPDGDAVGKRFRMEGTNWVTIVGVADDLNALGAPSDANGLQVHLPPSEARPRRTLIVRADGDAMALVLALKRAVAALDPEVPLRDVTRVDDALARTTARTRFAMTLLTALAAVAVVLGAVGLYGVTALSATQRRREIGIQIALGATQRDVLSSVLAEATAPAVLGIALGVGTSLAVTPVLRGLIFELSPHDPGTLSMAATLLVFVALAACWLPARRAVRTDPMITLRSE